MKMKEIGPRVGCMSPASLESANVNVLSFAVLFHMKLMNPQFMKYIPNITVKFCLSYQYKWDKYCVVNVLLGGLLENERAREHKGVRAKF